MVRCQLIWWGALNFDPVGPLNSTPAPKLNQIYDRRCPLPAELEWLYRLREHLDDGCYAVAPAHLASIHDSIIERPNPASCHPNCLGHKNAF